MRRGVTAVVTLQTEQPVTIKEYGRLLEAKLKEANIGLFPIATNRLVATWIDSSKRPGISRAAPRTGRASSYRELLEKRRADRERELATRPPAPKLTGEELQERLRKYNMELIRKGELPLPIKLTPEEDAQLVKEGILPPIEGGSSGGAQPDKKEEDGSKGTEEQE